MLCFWWSIDIIDIIAGIISAVAHLIKFVTLAGLGNELTWRVPKLVSYAIKTSKQHLRYLHRNDINEIHGRINISE